jgi:hypothetical protein
LENLPFFMTNQACIHIDRFRTFRRSTMMRALALAAALLATANAYPSHYHSCTFNFTGGERLPFPFCAYQRSEPAAARALFRAGQQLRCTCLADALLHGRTCVIAGNSSLPAAERVQDLLSRMTYEEKAASLDTSNPAIERLGVASMQGGECTHGVAGGCGAAAAGSTGCPTSFPSGPSLGATFDTDLWSKVGQTIGREARALNNQAIPVPDADGVGGEGGPLRGVPGLPPNGKSGIYFLDPNINLMRDPRWGRAQEVPGECPMLTSEYAAHFIGGAQRGNATTTADEDPRYWLSAVTAKHFTMYDMEGYIPRTALDAKASIPGVPSATADTSGGVQRWNFDASPPLSDFVDYYMPPFKSAVRRPTGFPLKSVFVFVPSLSR